MSNLTLISTTSFTGSSSVVTDNVFTSTYDHYFILIKAENSTTSASLNLYLRSGGGANLTNKIWQYYDADGSTINKASATTTYLMVGGSTANNPSLTTVYMFNPAVSGKTTKTVSQVADTLNGVRILSFAGYSTSTGAFDGFSIDPASNTITGTLWVYGFPKS